MSNLKRRGKLKENKYNVADCQLFLFEWKLKGGVGGSSQPMESSMNAAPSTTITTSTSNSTSDATYAKPNKVQRSGNKDQLDSMLGNLQVYLISLSLFLSLPFENIWFYHNSASWYLLNLRWTFVYWNCCIWNWLVVVLMEFFLIIAMLQADMNKQGISATTKGCCTACDKPIVGQVIHLFLCFV